MFSSVEKIDSSLNSQIDSLNSILQSTEELKERFQTVERKTIDAIRERENSINEFRKISDQLRKQLKNEKLNLESLAPKVTIISQDIFLIKPDSLTYSIQIRFKNMGKRTASKFRYGGIMIFVDKAGKLVEHTIINKYENSNDNLFPHGETGHFTTLTLGSYEKNKIESEYIYAVILLNVEYEDILVNNSIIDYMNFEWKGLDKGFSRYQGNFSPIIKAYIKEKKLTDLVNVKL